MRPIRFVLVTTVFIIAALAFAGLALAGRTPASDAAAADNVKYMPIPAGSYRIDPPHTVVGFSIRHLEINWVSGRFRDVEGSINFDDHDISKSSVNFKAKIDSVDTGIAGRDKHLKTADFFDAAKF